MANFGAIIVIFFTTLALYAATAAGRVGNDNNVQATTVGNDYHHNQTTATGNDYHDQNNTIGNDYTVMSIDDPDNQGESPNEYEEYQSYGENFRGFPTKEPPPSTDLPTATNKYQKTCYPRCNTEYAGCRNNSILFIQEEADTYVEEMYHCYEHYQLCKINCSTL